MTTPEPSASASPFVYPGTTYQEVRAWMDARGISINSLANMLGIDHKTLQRWLHARTNPPPYLGYALNWLDYRDGRLRGQF